MQALQERIGYRFRDAALLLRALTHSSYVNEQKRAQGEDYERLEFLGDAVLEMIASVFLYQNYPDMREGDMTKTRAALVCEDALHKCAEKVGLKDFVRLGKGEEATGGRLRASIISDVMEALIGAIYLDGGFAEAERFIRALILREIPDVPDAGDYKSALQTLLQQEHKQNLRYEVVKESGPDHSKVFEVAVYNGDALLGEGKGSSKQKAQQQAARAALESLQCKSSP